MRNKNRKTRNHTRKHKYLNVVKTMQNNKIVRTTTKKFSLVRQTLSIHQIHNQKSTINDKNYNHTHKGALTPTHKTN
jgi:hypothetical protein